MWNRIFKFEHSKLVHLNGVRRVSGMANIYRCAKCIVLAQVFRSSSPANFTKCHSVNENLWSSFANSAIPTIPANWQYWQSAGLKPLGKFFFNFERSLSHMVSVTKRIPVIHFAQKCRVFKRWATHRYLNRSGDWAMNQPIQRIQDLWAQDCKLFQSFRSLRTCMRL